jgi:hypothetical protein
MADKIDQVSIDLSKLYVPLDDYVTRNKIIDDQQAKQDKKLEELAFMVKQLESMLFKGVESGNIVKLPPKPEIPQPATSSAPITPVFVQAPASAAPVVKVADPAAKIKEFVNTNDAGFFEWYKTNIDTTFVAKELDQLGKLRLTMAIEKNLAKPSNKPKWQAYITAREN